MPPGGLRRNRFALTGGWLFIANWHNVESTAHFPVPPDAGPAGLERQLRVLSRFGTVVSLREAASRLADRRAVPRRAVALTFDDGYRDNLDVAVPILEGLGLTATFFLAPSMLSGSARPWWEDLAWGFHRTAERALAWNGDTLSLDETARASSFAAVSRRLKRMTEAERRSTVADLLERLMPGTPPPAPPFLDWDGARELVARGFDVGSHSMCHAILANESAAAQEEDLRSSRLLLEEGLGVAADVLAYPNGTALDFTETTVAAATAAGYRAAVTTIPGINRRGTPVLELRRYLLNPARGARDLAAIPRQAVGRARAAASPRRARRGR